MQNTQVLKFFEDMSKNQKDNPKSVKLACGTDYTQIDSDFIMRYANKNTSLLDIGTGTGLIVNKIFNKIREIYCIEPYSEFTKFIIKSNNVFIFNKNFFDFQTDKAFDLITIFGTMHYVNENEAVEIYKKSYSLLKKNGHIIIKNQFGVDEDVNISGYSEEQKTNYYAQYRYINKEINILKEIGFKNIEKFDIYPPEANRWDNTHFWAIVGEK